MIDFINQNSIIKELYINKNTLNEIIEQFKEKIFENKNLFLELYKIDNEKNNKYMSIDGILNLLNLYKNVKVEEEEKKLIIASYEGNPYITINLCMQALSKKRGTIMVIEDCMLGINKLLINIFNNILQEHRILKMVEIYNNVNLEEIKKMQDKVNYIVCIGNSYTYYKYCKEEIKNLKYIPFKNFALYCSSKEFEDIKYELYKYAMKMGIEAEIYEHSDEFIDCVNEDECLESVIILSKNENEVQECKKRIKYLKIFVNENPFKNEKFKIDI